VSLTRSDAPVQPDHLNFPCRLASITISSARDHARELLAILLLLLLPVNSPEDFCTYWAPRCPSVSSYDRCPTPTHSPSNTIISQFLGLAGHERGILWICRRWRIQRIYFILVKTCFTSRIESCSLFLSHGCSWLGWPSLFGWVLGVLALFFRWDFFNSHPSELQYLSVVQHNLFSLQHV
jgi:hypothetical protein